MRILGLYIDVVALVVGTPLMTGCTTYYQPGDLIPGRATIPAGDIRMRGYLVFSPSGHVLYRNKEVLERISSGDVSEIRDNPFLCLTIANPDRLDEKGVGFGRKMITLRGLMITDYGEDGSIDLGGCQNSTAFLIK